jgi:hypothetical protein
LEAVVASARARLNALRNYQVRINRQERVGDRLLPAEDVVLSIRRDPKAIRLEWPEGPHKGREVIYCADAHGGLMHVNMADAPVPVQRLTLPPDSPLILSNSRHPITEAGFETILDHLEAALAASRSGSPAGGRLTDAGLEQPVPLERPCQKLVQVKPSGETWVVYIDPQSHLPALVQANAANGDLLERYIFRDPRPDRPELTEAAAFDPDRRWGPAQGLLQRLAKAVGTETKPAADSIAR